VAVFVGMNAIAGGTGRAGRFRRAVAVVAAAVLVLGSGRFVAPTADAKELRPVYAIAHGVNDFDALDRALRAGATGVEVDICANDSAADLVPWYVAHDCATPPRVLPTSDMFARLAAPPGGKKPLLVWLDIKTPDRCASSASECSTRGLADQAKVLTDAGIQVLYDLTSEDYRKNKPTLGGPGYANLSSRLTALDADGVPLEGVGFWGDPRTAVKVFERAGVAPGRRVLVVGDCGSIHRREVRGDVEIGAIERGKRSPRLAAILVWTMYETGLKECENVLGTADGMIAGNHDFGLDPDDPETLRSVTKPGVNLPVAEGHRLFRA
jgi:hypothetical protein